MLSGEIMNRRYIFNALTYKMLVMQWPCRRRLGVWISIEHYLYEFKCCLNRAGKKLPVRRRKSSDTSGRAPNAGIVLRVGIPGDISRCDITSEPGIVGKLSILYIFRDLFGSATITLSVNTVWMKLVKIAQNLKVVTRRSKNFIIFITIKIFR